MGSHSEGSKQWFGKRPGLFVSNVRFYILIFSVLLSILMASYLRTIVLSDSVYAIRVQQVFGFLSLTYLYLALLATPLSKVFGKQGTMKHYLFSRRALGVSAAYFATLHMLIGLFGQLGGLGNLLLLPSRSQVALLLGATGLVILLAMAATSFDKVIKKMTFPRWKWLQRLIYLVVVLVFLHVWMLGSHISYVWIKQALFGALVLLAGLESWRGALQLRKKLGGASALVLALFFITFFVSSVAVIIILPQLVDSNAETHSLEGGR